MSVDKVIGSLGRGAQEAMRPSFSLPADGDFASGLNIGQIIKGRVLRHYEGNRYLVSFSGQEKVVDSSIALRTDDVIHGKVVALGERVELQRVRVESGTRSAEGAATTGVFGRNEKLVDELFQRYLATLSAPDRETLLQHVKASADPGSVARAGLVLNKLGVLLHPELLHAVFAVLRSAGDRGVFSPPATAPRLESARRAEAKQPAYGDIGAAIANLIKEVPERRWTEERALRDAPAQTPRHEDATGGARGQEADTQGDARYDLGRWILNVQTDGTVAHRLGSFALRLGDRLVEVDMALFEQRRQPGQKPDLLHRQIVFALELERLGRVEVMAKVAGQHVRVHVATAEPESTDTVARYLADLRRELEATGWQVDEVVYETRKEQDNVVWSVVDHITSQDSLSRLL